MSNVERVRPETGLFEEPMRPHKLPGDRCKEEAENEHDHGGDEAGNDLAGEINVEPDHGCENDTDEAEHDFRCSYSVRCD